MSRESETKYQAQLRTQIGVLDAWISGCADKTTQRFREKVRRKQELLNELKLSESRQASASPLKGRLGSMKSSAEAEETQARTSARSSQPWYESSADILHRRQIVLRNPRFSSESLCRVFDTQRIPLPAKWEQRFGVVQWSEAYKNKKARALIQKLVSTDKKKKF